MKRDEVERIKDEEHKLKNLEKSKVWKDAVQNMVRFDDEEKTFFLDRISHHHLQKNKIGIKYYIKLIEAIARNYDPATEARRTRFMMLIEEEDRNEQMRNLLK